MHASGIYYFKKKRKIWSDIMDGNCEEWEKYTLVLSSHCMAVDQRRAVSSAV